MNLALRRIHSDEALHVVIFVILAFCTSLILEANEVVATSGFVSTIGISYLPWVWAVDMVIVMGSAAVYSAIIDRKARSKLAVALFGAFGALYGLLYLLFQIPSWRWLAYPLLTVITDQHWLVFGLMIWALVNDVFSTAQAKRLSPLISTSIMLGGIVGNGVVTTMAHWLADGGDRLLLFNALLLLLLGAVLFLFQHLGLIEISARISQEGESLKEVVRGGFDFVRDVPIFRYLALAMIPLGLGLNALEFSLLQAIVLQESGNVQSIYGSFKLVTGITILAVQSLAATPLINQLELRRIFALTPVVMLFALMLVLVAPGFGVFIGAYLVRTLLNGVDEPARQVLLTLPPDECRGRVGAFLNGYLYPLGSAIGCLVIGVLYVGVDWGLISTNWAKLIYLGLAVSCILFALWCTWQINQQYRASLLNWRLGRRKRGSHLPNLEF